MIEGFFVGVEMLFQFGFLWGRKILANIVLRYFIFLLAISLGITEIYWLFSLNVHRLPLLSRGDFSCREGPVYRLLRLWPAVVTIGNLDKMADER